jgi:hypothetical protein
MELIVCGGIVVVLAMVEVKQLVAGLIHKVTVMGDDDQCPLIIVEGIDFFLI